MGFVVKELLGAGLAHNDVTTIAGEGGLARYAQEPFLKEGEELSWRDGAVESGNTDIVRPASAPFSEDGGLRVITGQIGRGVMKVSAVKPEHRKVTAPARVFQNQNDVKAAFKAGELDKDVVIVVRFQGPRASGMPELHSLSPILGGLQDRGFKVALVTDGRMSGATGKFPAVIHLCPEALTGGPITKIRDGDIINLDADAGTIEISSEDFLSREPAARNHDPGYGLGRELFAPFRAIAADAEHGGGIFGAMEDLGA